MIINKSIRKSFKLNKRRGLRLRRRFFASAGAPGELTQTSLGSGVKVVTCQSDSPLMNISLYVNGGARFENYLTKGSTHFLKHFAFKGNKKNTHLI